MQEPHERDHHHPARLSRALGVAAAALALAPAAHAAGRIALPSAVAGLSAEPPLAGGASASAEGVRHRITASTLVTVSIDPDGRPFAVQAVQRLDVRVQGDYFFTIGAPLIDVRAGPGSASAPGLRSRSIVWAGFDPGRRVLVADATLRPGRAVAALPLRVRQAGGRTVLENATRVVVGSYSADAPREPLLRYLRRLRSDVAHRRLPVSTTVPVTTEPVRERTAIVVPLRVTGTVGARRVDLVLRGGAVVPASGRVDLRVEPVETVEAGDALEGRALFRAAVRTALTLARARQYETFLGNPDPAGRSDTAYVYRSARRPTAAPAAAVPAPHGRDWAVTALVAVGAAVALGAAVAVWARS